MTAKKNDPKKGTKKPEDKSAAGSYIEHEEVKTDKPKVEEATEVEVEEITTEKRITMEIAKFNMPEAKVAEWKQQYGSLTIAGPEDKEGYKAVRAAWLHMRTIRTSLEKKGKEIRQAFTIITKAISTEEDRLIDLVTPLEEELQKKWKKIDDDKEAEDNRLKKEEEDRLLARIQELLNLGMKLENGFYEIGGTISFDVATIRSANDEQYGKMKAVVTTKKGELDKKAEDERLKKEQDEKDLKDQQEKLNKEKEELRGQRREVRIGKLEALGMILAGTGAEEVVHYQWIRLYTAPLLDLTADEFAKVIESTTAEIKKIKDEAAKEEVTKKRLAHIRSLGMVDKADTFVFDNGFSTVTHSIKSLMDLDDYGFEQHAKILADNITAANEAKAKNDEEKETEEKKLEEKKTFISKAMETAGMSFIYAAETFQFKNDILDLRLKWNDLLPLTEEAITLKAQEVAEQILQAKNAQKVKDDEDAKEKKRKEKAGQEDSVKWKKLLDSILLDVKEAEFTTTDYQEKKKGLLQFIQNLNKAK